MGKIERLIDSAMEGKNERADGGWTFLSNHAHVLMSIAVDPEVRLKDVAQRVGITERAVQRIVGDLEDGGYLTRERTGRRNRYRLHPEKPLRHPTLAHRKVRELLALVLTAEEIHKVSRGFPASR